MKYRIIESAYYDEYGKQKSKYYYIQKQKQFLGIKYWGYHTHTECGYGDCYDVNTEFKTYEDANKFIQTHLCGRDFKEGWKYYIMREVDCNASENHNKINSAKNEHKE